MTATMSLKCDVFGSRRTTKAYRILIEKSDAEENLFGVEPIWIDMLKAEVHLSSRGFKRLMKFVERGLLPPKRHAKKNKPVCS